MSQPELCSCPRTVVDAVDFVYAAVHVAAGVVVDAADAVVDAAVDAADFVVAGRALLRRVMQPLLAFLFAAGSRQQQSRQRLDSKHRAKSRL